MKASTPRGIPGRQPDKDAIGPRVVKSVISKHVQAFAKADVGSVDAPAPKLTPSAPPAAGTFGHATIPSRFQSGASTHPPTRSAQAPLAKNRDLHPASAPHPAHSGKPNRR